MRRVSFGTGEARLASLVSKDRRHKPVVKTAGGQRESDGVVVPLQGREGPRLRSCREQGTSEGVVGTASPNYPEGRHVAPVKVRRLQNRLWAAAKQSKGRRFHALYDRIYRDDILWEAWERVRANRGAAGVDAVTVAAVEAYGVEQMLTNSTKASVQASTAQSPCGGWRSQSPMGQSARWASQQSRIGWSNKRPRSSSSRFSRPTSWTAPMGSARSARPPTPWRGSEQASSRATPSSSKPISRTSSARSTTRGCSRWSRCGCRTVGCSSSFDCGCVQACWTPVSSPRRSAGRPKEG